jgi:transglutaminase-like putative cysteine protease
MIYHVRHNTTYRYATAAEACHNMLRLDPRTTPGQTCLDVALEIHPAPAKIHSYIDYFGNRVRSFAVFQPHEELSITSESRVEIDRPAVPREDPSPSWTDVRRRLRHDRDDATIDALQYVFDSVYIRSSAALADYAFPSFTKGRSLLAAVAELTTRIFKEFAYDPAATTIDTKIEDVLERRRGVCQDFAHLQIGCLKSLGLAARYVSGYLRTETRPGQTRLQGADASHAWLSVFCPDNGWVDFDPTNGCQVTDHHISLGWGRDFHDVSPIKGVVLGGGSSTLSVAVDVTLHSELSGAESSGTVAKP